MFLDFWMIVLENVFQMAAALFLFYSTLTNEPVSSDIRADTNTTSLVHLHLVLGAERWL